jgi:hypothetical protein
MCQTGGVDSMILRKLRTLRSFGWSGTYLIAEATLLTVVIPAGFRLVGVVPSGIQQCLQVADSSSLRIPRLPPLPQTIARYCTLAG